VEPFLQRFPKESFPNLSHLDAGSYSRVLKTNSVDDRDCVIKLIKLRKLGE